MRLYALRIIVALLTFGVGLGASALWNVFGVAKRLVSATPEVQGQLVLVRNGEILGTATSALNSQTVHGGILTGKAVSKPAPVYPEIARAARARGTVVVDIVVDENGDVASASAASGHPLLQQAAVEAVRRWKFSPTRLSGEPVKVSGRVTVNFVLE